MASVVVDASLALKWVMAQPYSLQADALAARWVTTGIEAIAPALLAFEVTNALYRKSPPGVGTSWLRQGLSNVLGAVRLVPPVPDVLERAAVIAAQLGRPAAYDAQYAALAERESCELWTADERFYNAASPRFPWVR